MLTMCRKCTMGSAVLLLLLGAIFLSVDFGFWSFFGISWWTALFLVMGIVFLLKEQCDSCCDLRPKTKKK